MAKIVVSMPDVRDLNISATEKTGLAKNMIDLVVDEIAMRHHWDFAVDVCDIATVASQQDYVLKGNNNNCRTVFNVRYGLSSAADDGLTVLRKRGNADADEWLNHRTVSGVLFWTPNGEVGGYPRIRIVEAPTTATYIFRYRYWKDNVVYEGLPVGFHSAILAGVRSKFNPVLTGVYDKQIKQLIARYSPSGGEADPAKLGYWMVMDNNDIATKYGYGS